LTRRRFFKITDCDLREMADMGMFRM
jgi:hypothetical protein